MDYTSILNTISSKLDDIYNLLNNLKTSEFLELIVMILFFILLINVERGY